jgi:nitrite reductase (cytochrome c-552)
MATHQEMRTFVCGQCHVEYYFKGPEKRLVYPWDKGLKIENIVASYEENGHKDWVHADTGAPVLKAQHPEFELYSQGIHARSGVACADCHMPYVRQGAMKISDHHVRSPSSTSSGRARRATAGPRRSCAPARRSSRSAPSICATRRSMRWWR